MSKTHQKYTDAYIKILDTYNKYLSNSIINKKDLKQRFFNMIKIIMYVLTSLFIVTILLSFAVFIMAIYKDYKSISVIAGSITTLISTFVTMLISLLVLPRIIADYLFNKDEDDKMNDIIKNIQKYEIDTVYNKNMIKKAKFDSEEMKSNSNEDEELTENLSLDNNSTDKNKPTPSDKPDDNNGSDSKEEG